jgi:transcriptional regulator of acetoin/glycerol metabolism
MLPSRSMTDARDFEHALMNHLAIVLGFSQLLLQDAPPDDPRRADLAEIHKAATAAVQILSAGVPRGVGGAVPPRRTEARLDGLDEVERDHIARVLADVQGNKLAAAKRLGISRRTLYRRLERHGLVERTANLRQLPADQPEAVNQAGP